LSILNLQKVMVTDETPVSAQVGKTRKAQSAVATRDRLLQATSHIIQTQGVERLTLDAVAKEAQVSKGGLLYHFASKEALVVGVIQYLMDDFDAAIVHELAQDHAPNSPGKWLRAYVQATFNYKILPISLITSLFSAVTNNPEELLKPVQSRFDDWQQKMEVSGLDPVRANLVRLATDGLGTNEMFGLSVTDDAMRQQLLEMLLEIIQEAESGDSNRTTALERTGKNLE
jgi:AcrR family transcriptional regulator